MDEKRQEVGGITFTGNITVNGPMFDIHDNEHVHIYADGQREQGEDEPRSPALDLLRQMVREVGDGKPKLVLMPYKAALSIGALPLWDYATFNRYMGTELKRNSYSHWVNGTQGYEYTDEEIDPYVVRFKALE